MTNRVALRNSAVLLLIVLSTLVLGCGREEEPATGTSPGREPPSAIHPERVEKQSTRTLGSGSVVDHRLAARGWDRFVVEMVAGELIEVRVEQEELDVALQVRGPDGDLLLRLDSPLGRREPEHLLFAADESGPHRLEVENISSSRDGRYRLEVLELAPATAEERHRARALASLASAHELRRDGSLIEAISRYEQAARRFRELGHPAREAVAHEWRGRCLGRVGRHQDAAAALRLAAEGFRRAGESRREASVLDALGATFRRLGRSEDALDCYRRSLDRWRHVGSAVGRARALGRLASLHKARAELAAAEARYEEALELWYTLDRRRDQAITLGNLAGIYTVVGQEELALDLLARASTLLPEGSGSQVRAFLLHETGLAYRRSRRPERARRAYEEALEHCRRGGKPSAICSSVLDGLGRLHYEGARYEQARRLFRDALEQLEAEENPRREATLIQNLAWLHLHRGAPEEALRLFHRALPTLRETAFTAGEVTTLQGIARVERQRGHLQAASLWARWSLQALERLRSRSDRPDMRAALLADKQEYFDFAVDTLMELDRREPKAGYQAEAFLVSETARARRLGDVLATSSRQEHPQVARTFEALERKVSAAERERLHLLATSEDKVKLKRTERRLRASLDDLREAKKAMALSGAPATAFRPRGVTAIQSSLLNPGTLLLKYELAGERSYLWVVSVEAVAVFELPAGERIERLAESLHELLSLSDRRGSSSRVELRAAELSAMILAPAADLLDGGQRLLISAEGALHAIPFGVLPHPGRAGRALLEDHEISYIPSASLMLWMRRARKETPPGGVTLAVVADPVFGKTDARLAHRVQNTLPMEGQERRGSRLLGRLAPSRLAHAGEEADRILEMLPPGQTLSLRGFEASKERVESGALADARILHFATHGRFSADHPELSALLLSRLDERGRPHEGLLWAHEISTLTLSADLVVLSACDTALGARIHGEGLVGLSHAFFQAGARRVLVSLWHVDDAAAVELMTRFYSALLREGLSPGAALRRARLNLRREPRWSRPYYWAGFVLQGMH